MVNIVCWIMHFCSCPVYCKMFCSNRGLRSQDASSTLELGQLFVVSRHCQMSLKGQIAPSWEQTTLETLLPTKPFQIHHHPTFLFVPITTKFPGGPLTLLISTSSPFSQPWIRLLMLPYPLPNIEYIRGTKGTSWQPNPASGLFSVVQFSATFDTMASFYGIHLVYYFGSLPISLSLLDLLSPLLSKYRDATVCRPLLSAFSQFLSHLMSLLVTPMQIAPKYRFCLSAALQA